MSDISQTLSKNRFEVNLASTDLVFRTIYFGEGRPTGRQVIQASGIGTPEEIVLLQWLTSGDIEEIRPDESVQATSDEPVNLVYGRTDRLYRLTVNQRAILWPDKTITEKQLRVIGRIPVDQELFLNLKDQEDFKIESGQPLDLANMGSESVYSVAPFWTINVQGVIIQSETPQLTVREALLKAGFDPDKNWIIVAKKSNGKAQLNIDEVIDLSECDIEKIRLTPHEINNGDTRSSTVVTPAFALLPSDDEGLAQRGLEPRRLIERGRRWLIFVDYRLPKGLSPKAILLAIEIPSSYPRAEIDMFYCCPAVHRVDGKGIPQTQVSERIAGKVFQRWSRHRGALSQWDPTTDTVLTHLALVDAALLAEDTSEQ